MSYREGSLEARLLAGDPEILGIVIRWIARVLATPRFWPLRPEWPDLQQEVMARVIESLRRDRFDPTRDLRVYVQAVARYTAVESLSAWYERSPGRSMTDPPQERAGELETEVVSSQFARAVLECATDECRGLIRAYFYEQRSYEEIARAEGLPVGTVKSRLSRCLEKVHRTMAWRKAGRRPVAQD